MDIKTVLKNSFIGSSNNNYRPHFIRVRFLLAATLLLLSVYGVLTFVANQQYAKSVQGGELSSAHLLDITNSNREKNGEPPLQLNAALQLAAQAKVANMFADNYWSHTSPTGVTPWFWLDQQGYPYAGAGENLARGFMSGNDLINAWMDSPAHRQNMLNKTFTQVGFASAKGKLQGEQTTLVVAFYAEPASLQAGSIAGNGAGVFATPQPLLARGFAPTYYVAITGVVLAGIALGVTLIAHINHMRVPRNLRRVWYKHHMLYTTLALLAVLLGLIMFISMR